MYSKKMYQQHGELTTVRRSLPVQCVWQCIVFPMTYPSSGEILAVLRMVWTRQYALNVNDTFVKKSETTLLLK